MTDAARDISVKPVIGLAGAIGAGKSTVAAEFAAEGCRVIDSDALNREMLAHPDVAATLRDWWGDTILGPDGGVDRGKIAGIVFGDPDQRKRLENLLHPLIADRRRATIRLSNSDPAVKAVVLDSPLLFESSLVRECDVVVFVQASKDTRLSRLRQSRQWDAAELDRRERAQWPADEKRRLSDYVIDNEGSPDSVRGQVLDILTRVLA